jgi:hypothetical protein
VAGAGPDDRLVVAGLSPDLHAVGSFVALVVARVPILVVRGEDGALRAAGNVCHHRDPLVEAEHAGRGMWSTRAFTCPFAGWPGPHEGSGRLHALPVVMTHGVVLVRPHGGAPIDRDALLDDRTGRGLDDLGLDRHEPAGGTREIVDDSWRDVVAGLAAQPGAVTVAGHAVVTPGRDGSGLDLHRAFALGDDGCVLDRRSYRLRA